MKLLPKEQRCKGITQRGDPCLNKIQLHGYCTMHFWIKKEEVDKLNKVSQNVEEASELRRTIHETR